ncbi:hypothetical protein AQUCO_00300035v1 [Aquilegia coerulea]|uniref:Pectin acetylesterase n=1 Tax=Aquilegia coerulea TaxID=218851 RepID=A0A2G5EWU7_AQUCA|nr:hypothetical protein AQUCO_00300035v1 [Aquilegia coerulea]
MLQLSLDPSPPISTRFFSELFIIEEEEMANRESSSIWSRKWGKKDYGTIAVAAFTILSFALLFTLDPSSSSSSSSSYSSSSTNNNKVNNPLVKLTLLPNAKLTGAVCLDGSSPGFHFQKGFGSGSDSWVLHIEGGGWCDSIESCSSRQLTALGSSEAMDHEVPFSGILSQVASQNPDFFNWNKVKIRYCDGASLSGNPESEFQVYLNEAKLFFRGRLIWKAIIDEISTMGLANAKQDALLEDWQL